MAKSSIHIQGGKIGFFSHNSREKKTVNAIFNDESNFISCDNKTAIENFKNELKLRTLKYLQNHPTRKKLHSKTLTHLSAIVNFNKNHTPQDIKKVCDYLEKTLDTKVIQFAMHRDEGHINDKGEPIKNYHAHIEFLGLDSEGNSIRRKLDRKYLINLQSEVANILNMQRGKNYTLLQAPRPKRLDTYEYKEMAKQRGEAVKELAKTKDLQEINKQLRAELKEAAATREDYAQLEQLNKDLKTRVKNKDLTIQELNNIINEYKQEKALRILNLKKEIIAKKEQKENANKALEQTKELKAENDTLKSDLNDLRADMSVLNTSLIDSRREVQEKDKTIQRYENKQKNLEDQLKSFDKDQSKPWFRRLIDYINNINKRLNHAIKENQELKEKIKEKEINKPLEEILKSPIKKEDQEYNYLENVEAYIKECEKKYSDADVGTELK